MFRHYMFDSKTKRITHTEDWNEWCRWFDNHGDDAVVQVTEVGPAVCVSTVFFGLGHLYDYSGNPLLFETMVFGGRFHEEVERSHTYEEAETTHRLVCEKVRGHLSALKTGDEVLDSLRSEERE